MKISIAGQDIKLSELKDDINTAAKKGYHYTNDFAFTCATVQGLVEKIEELSQNTILMHVFTKMQPETHRAKCIYKKQVPLNAIPRKGDYICISDGFCLELVTSVHITYEPILQVEVHVDTTDHLNEYKSYKI